ncbi:MAG: hypothetical protein J5915_03070 [Acidaminococcaceae bacterium]|nr:hypothetical protein [Acidaminococcaceae bacterium]
MDEAKNLIPEIMKLLGLQMGELFHVVIDGVENKLVSFYFNDHELMYLASSDNEPRLASDRTVIGLIYGGYEVKKLPWEPKIGEDYWCVLPSSDPDHPRTSLMSMNKSVFSLLNLINHNYFRTQDEAEANKMDFVKELRAIVDNGADK